MTSTDQVIVTDKHANTGTSVTNVMAHTPDMHASLSIPSKLMMKNTPGNEFTNHPGQHENEETSLPTPVSVQTLEESLSGHPDKDFVSQLCNNFKHGVRIGFQGQRAPRFSKNLPTAFAKPDIVSSNLANEILLGRMAGPFDTPPFRNFTNWLST